MNTSATTGRIAMGGGTGPIRFGRIRRELADLSPLVGTELHKTRTTRALFVATGVVALFAVAIPAVASALAGTGDIPPLAPSSLTDILRSPSPVADKAVLILGLLGTAGEFRHRTIVTTHLAEPRRLRVLAAKLLAYAAVGAALGVVAVVAAGVTGVTVLHLHGVPVQLTRHGTPAVAAALPLALALYSMLGVAVGALTRNTAAAVGTALAWIFAVEGIIPVVTRTPAVAYWLPGNAFQAVLHAGGPGAHNGFAPGAGVALLLGWAALLIAATILLDRRREI
jgi:hypothetical protein